MGSFLNEFFYFYVYSLQSIVSFHDTWKTYPPLLKDTEDKTVFTCAASLVASKSSRLAKEIRRLLLEATNLVDVLQRTILKPRYKYQITARHPVLKTSGLITGLRSWSALLMSIIQD